MKKFIYLTVFILGLLIPSMHAQIVSVAQGSGLNIKAGTVIGAAGLDLTPSADFSLTSSLSRSATVSNTTTIPYINRSYKFGATTAAFSGALQLNYQDSELNGLTESNLKLLYNDGVTWAADNASVNNATANYETATLTAKPLNELSLGINNSSSTTILDSQCGTTLAGISSTISCYPVTGATSYKFKIVDMSTNVTRYYFTAINNSFNLKMLSGTLYATSYSISVAATVGKSLTAYGSACTITTPYPLTKVKGTQCGATLAALNTTISSIAVTGATGYRFEVTNANDVYTYDSLTTSFNLSMLNSPVVYGKTYAVRVSVKYNNVWQPYGDSCNVTTPASPAKVQATQCGATLTALNTTISSVAVTGATGYRFEVTNANDVYTYDSLTTSFNLSMLNSPVVYGKTYAVRVSVKYNNVWQPYGDSCNVTTPASPAKVQATQCGATLTALNTTISSVAVTGATGYRFEVTNANDVYTYDSLTTSFNLSMLNSPVVYGKTYAVRVSVKYNNVWQPYGDSCNVTTPASPAKVQATQCGATLTALNTTISSVAVTGATGYRFEVTNANDVYTYDSLTRSFNLMQLNAVILYSTTYSIRVSVKLYNEWQPYGDSCNVTTPVAPLTKLQTSQCGITLASGNATVLTATAVTVAQMYRFEVSLGSSVYTYDTASSSVRSFKLTDVSGLSLVSGTTYGVRVAIKANGVWQPYGLSCNVTTFGAAPSILKMDIVAEDDFNAISYPNPFKENFNLHLTSSSLEKVSVIVYDMAGRLIEQREVNPEALSGLQVGDNYPSGVFNVIVKQGENNKTIRVIKR